MDLRSALKRAAYRSGVLGALHQRRNRHCLTVAMFHRVLPETAPEWRTADPTYTVSDRLFAQCLDFFKRHYSVVPLSAVLEAGEGRAALPERPLLVTFDDGWADNEAVALPLLRRAGVPAVVFVVSDAVDESPLPWWQETLVAAWREGRLAGEAGHVLWREAGGSEAPPDLTDADGVFALAARLAALDADRRDRLLASFRNGTERRDMLTPGQLRGLAKGGMAIGSHGATHLPLTFVADPVSELRQARRDLAVLLGDERHASGPLALSFPHGRYTPATVAAAREAGYRAIFTSDYRLTPLTAGRPGTDLFGRISIEASQIAGRDGELRPELLALWLFFRPAGPVA